MKTKQLIILMLLGFLMILVGCGETNNNNGKQDDKNKEILTCNIVSTSIPESIKAFDFDVSSIKVKIYYTDGTGSEDSLNQTNFTQGELDKLNRIGSQEINCIYHNEALSFNVNVLKGDSENYNINKLVATITTSNNDYLVRVTSNTKATFEATCKTNESLNDATLIISLPSEFVIDPSLLLEVTLNGEKLDSKNYTMNDNQLTYVFVDAFWSPLA